MRHIVSALLMSVSLAAVAAPECTAVSEPFTKALLELYTSEGCDSSPPAERWLARLAPADRERVVPLAFHVDYWDYLGWKDRFGAAAFSERQRQLARATGTHAVYTPQVVLAGKDFSTWWSGGDLTKALDGIAKQPAKMRLKIVQSEGHVRVTARLTRNVPVADLALFVALTQDGLSSHVTAGENRGATLAHEYVVRDLRVTREWLASEVTKATYVGPVRLQPEWNPERVSVVAFVQDLRTGEVLQALSTPYCWR
jgi:hypothetical protein